MTNRICSIETCPEPHTARGWCSKHYQRWQMHGDPLAVKHHRLDPDEAIACMRAAGIEPKGPYPGSHRPWPGVCMTCGADVAPRLNDIRRGQGGCRPCRYVKTSGSSHHMWAGDGASYQAVHQRIRKQRGKASEHQCVQCEGKQAAAHWAYDHSDPNERVGTDGGCELSYSTDPMRYQPMCTPCHKAYDLAVARTG